MFDRINHVAIAVTEIDEALALYDERFGTRLLHRESLDDGTVEAAMLSAGSDRVELLSSRDPQSTVGRFLSKRGPGMHHVAYDVGDIDAALATLRERDVRLLDTVARPGFGGTRVAFVHPSSCFGVLTELVEQAA